MRPSRPSMRVSLSLAWLLGLMVFAGLSACGPAAPDDLAKDSRAGLVGPSTPEQAPVSGSAPTTPAASLAPLAAPTRSAAPLVVPDSLRDALASPDVRVRLKAVEGWGQSAPPGAVDPLILALEDTDERVQARALELIAQDWMRAQAAKAEAKR